MPAREAASCGLPAVYTNYSSHAEFLRHSPISVPVSGMLQPEARTCIWRMIADVEQTISACRSLFDKRNIRSKRETPVFFREHSPEHQAEQLHNLMQISLQKMSELSN